MKKVTAYHKTVYQHLVQCDQNRPVFWLV
jgi:hypothetical protein